MKLGFLTGEIKDIEKAKRLGFGGIELHARAFGDPLQGDLDRAKIADAKKLTQQHGIEITALAFYHCASKPEEVTRAVTLYTRVFDAAEQLGVKVVATMSGFDSNLKWDENVKFFADRFGPVSALAEKRGMRLAFENWMSVHGRLPHKPVNMGGCPGAWEEWFKAVPSRALGIEFDPSHLYWQGIDHIRVLKEFKDRVHHVHAKDTEMLAEVRYRWGINADNFRFRIPGYGEINWPQFIAALVEIGYDGGVAIEHEDPVFTGPRFDEGLVRGWQVLDPLIQ
jgi:sugar phosphate isomerase/epimerase